MILSENHGSAGSFQGQVLRNLDGRFAPGARAVSDEVPIEHHTVQREAEHLEGRLQDRSQGSRITKGVPLK